MRSFSSVTTSPLFVGSVYGGAIPFADRSRNVPATLASVVGSWICRSGDSVLLHAISAIAPQSATRRRIVNLGREKVKGRTTGREPEDDGTSTHMRRGGL